MLVEIICATWLILLDYRGAQTILGEKFTHFFRQVFEFLELISDPAALQHCLGVGIGV